MSRYFLGPLKNPTWQDFVIRVGGVFVTFVVAILTAKTFFPGYESIAVLIVAGVGGVIVGVQTVRHNMNAKKTKHCTKKK